MRYNEGSLPQRVADQLNRVREHGLTYQLIINRRTIELHIQRGEETLGDFWSWIQPEYSVATESKRVNGVMLYYKLSTDEYNF